MRPCHRGRAEGAQAEEAQGATAIGRVISTYGRWGLQIMEVDTARLQPSKPSDGVLVSIGGERQVWVCTVQKMYILPSQLQRRGISYAESKAECQPTKHCKLYSSEILDRPRDRKAHGLCPQAQSLRTSRLDHGLGHLSSWTASLRGMRSPMAPSRARPGPHARPQGQERHAIPRSRRLLFHVVWRIPVPALITCTSLASVRPWLPRLPLCVTAPLRTWPAPHLNSRR
jgi:hypothetical protein